MPSKTPVIIYTDGACSGNPGPGGWGALLRYGAHVKEIRGGEPDTTNNRMEMMAVVRALEALKRPSCVTVITDSKYVYDGMLSWLEGWKRRNWRTADKKPVKNKDLWQCLDQLKDKHQITWQWVKGHAGDPGNERADFLARQGLEEGLTQNQGPEDRGEG